MSNPFSAVGRGFVLTAVLFGAFAAGAPFTAPREAHAQSRQGRPWLGLSMEDAKPQGVVKIRHVVRTSPAEKAGIRGGDGVLKVDGVRVATSSDVIRLVSAHAVGDTVPLTVTRDTKERVVNVTLANFPTSDEMIRMDFVGAFAPAWKGVDPVSGNVPASISALRGKVVMLGFWATWCGACRLQIPRLNAFHNRYAAQGLSVIGLASEESQEVGPHAARAGMQYAVGADKAGDTTQAYHVVSLPSVFVIDKRGVVRDVMVGFDPGREPQVEALVKQLLAEPAPVD
jgi:thiol-disulfide isomerase/thioredoxin